MQKYARRRRIGAAVRAGSGLLIFGAIAATGLPQPSEAGQSHSAEGFNIERRDEDQIRPRISGRHVVWQDYRNNGGAPTDESRVNADIYGRNIENDSDFRVTGNKTAARPAISGARVVYTDSRNSHSKGLDIRGYNVETGDVFQVIEDNGDQDYAAIDGDLVVYQDNQRGNWDIRGYDIDDDDDFNVVERGHDEKNPAISGRLVAYEDYRRGANSPDIYLKDIDDDETERVTENGESRDPAIDGDWIAYRTGDRDSNSQRIRLYQISTKETRTITERIRIGSGPRIDGNLVVWSDYRNDEEFNVWAYDIAADTAFRVSDSTQEELEPDISGTTVVWTIKRDDSKRDIRGARLTVPAAATPTATGGPTQTATPTEGAGPPRPAGPCSFTLGFKALRDQIPQVVGECLENEWHNADNGDALQQTTGGLLAWRKADNWTAFTNGSITWLNGPCGLQTRPNAGPFYSWEGRVGAGCS
jgi:beta propeller repeat protein